MLEKGWFVPVVYCGRTYYVKTEERTDNAIEGEFAVAVVELPLPKNREIPTKEMRQKLEKQKRVYYVPATGEIKADLEQKYKEVGRFLAGRLHKMK